MKKYYFITPNLANGGAERVTAVLANELARQGAPVCVAFTKDNEQAYPLDENIRVIRLYGKHRGLRRIMDKLFGLRRLIAGDPNGTFVAMLPYETLYTYTASRFLKRHIVYSLRNDPNHMHSRLDRFIWKVVYPSAGNIVFQTQDAQAFFPEKVQRKGIVIPNPISTNLPAPFSGSRETEIVTVGRLEPQKNYPLLLRSFAEVHAAHPDWILKIYGKGPLEQELKQLCGTLDIADSVFFCGFQRDVTAKINRSGLFVLSSDYEGISNAMLEALATGVPCICTDCPIGGARLMIQNGENGILVPVGDQQALFQAMCRLIEAPELAAQLSQTAVQRCQSLLPDRILKKWMNVL